MNHRSVAHIAPASRQAIGIVAVPLEVVAPGLTPEGRSDEAAFDLDRRNGTPLLPALLHFAYRRAPPLGNWNIRFPSPSVVVHRSGLLQRFVDIERNQLEQLIIIQLGQ